MLAVAISVAVAIAGMAGCLNPLSSTPSVVVGLRPQLIVASLLRCD